MQGKRRTSFALLAVAIIIAGVLVSATLILVPLSRSPTTVTATSISMTTEKTTLTNAVTSTETTTSTSVVTVPAACLPSQSHGYFFGTLVAGTGSPAIICVQVYWFNSTSPMLLNATSLLRIEGYSPSIGQAIFNPASNFTVAASVDQLTLGGPSNAGEGTILEYSITAKAGASGTYWLYLNGWQVQNDTEYPLVGCGRNGDLVAGNGQPNYAPDGNGQCIDRGVGLGMPSFNIPGIALGVPPNTICYKILTLTNSTQ